MQTDLRRVIVNYRYRTAYQVIRDLCQVYGSDSVIAAVETHDAEHRVAAERGDTPLPETSEGEKPDADKRGGSGQKLKLLNKETVSTVLLYELDCSPQEVADIVEFVWDSDMILQRIYAASSSSPVR